MLPCVSSPRRGSGSATRRKSVMPREALVDEREVGGDQIEDAAILPDNAVEEELSLADECVGERRVPVREKEAVGPHFLHVLQPQPLRRETRRERERPRIRHHARDLFIEDRRVAERAISRGFEQLLIRQRAPQEEREA